MSLILNLTRNGRTLPIHGVMCVESRADSIYIELARESSESEHGRLKTWGVRCTGSRDCYIIDQFDSITLSKKETKE